MHFYPTIGGQLNFLQTGPYRLWGNVHDRARIWPGAARPYWDPFAWRWGEHLWLRCDGSWGHATAL